MEVKVGVGELVAGGDHAEVQLELIINIIEDSGMVQQEETNHLRKIKQHTEADDDDQKEPDRDEYSATPEPDNLAELKWKGVVQMLKKHFSRRRQTL